MADAVLSVRDSGDPVTGYQRGDIIDAFSRRRIDFTHQDYFHKKQCLAINSDPMIGARGVPHQITDPNFYLLNEQYAHKLTQINSREMLRIDRVTLDEKVITGPSFDAQIGGQVVTIDYDQIYGKERHFGKTSWCAAFLGMSLLHPDSVVKHRVDVLNGQKRFFIEIDGRERMVGKTDALQANGLIDTSGPQSVVNDDYIAVQSTTAEFTYVEPYMRARRQHNQHRVFVDGDGNYVYHGGRLDRTSAASGRIWTHFERDLPLTRNDAKFRRVDVGRRPLLTMLSISLPDADVDDETQEDMKAPEVDDRNPDDVQIVQKRAMRIDWQNDLGLTDAEIARILDPTQAVDLRGVPDDPTDTRPKVEFAKAVVLDVKPSRRPDRQGKLALVRGKELTRGGRVLPPEKRG